MPRRAYFGTDKPDPMFMRASDDEGLDDEPLSAEEEMFYPKVETPHPGNQFFAPGEVMEEDMMRWVWEAAKRALGRPPVDNQEAINEAWKSLPSDGVGSGIEQMLQRDPSLRSPFGAQRGQTPMPGPKRIQTPARPGLRPDIEYRPDNLRTPLKEVPTS